MKPDDYNIKQNNNEEINFRRSIFSPKIYGWTANLYVNLLIWRQYNKSPTSPDRGHDPRLQRNIKTRDLPDLPRSGPHRQSAPNILEAAQRVPDGPWDDALRPNNRLRSCLIMAGLLALAWAVSDRAVLALADFDLGRLLSRP